MADYAVPTAHVPASGYVLQVVEVTVAGKSFIQTKAFFLDGRSNCCEKRSSKSKRPPSFYDTQDLLGAEYPTDEVRVANGIGRFEHKSDVGYRMHTCYDAHGGGG